MNAKSIDAHVTEDGLIVQGDPAAGAKISRGITCSTSSLKNVTSAYYNKVEHYLRMALAVMAEFLGVKVQIRWGTSSSSYQPISDNYYGETLAHTADDRWARIIRDEKAVRFHDLMENGQLRRTHCEIYASMHAVGTDIESKASKLTFLLAQVGKCYESLGGSWHHLSGEEVMISLFRHFNPSEANKLSDELAPMIDLKKTVMQNCLSSDYAPLFGKSCNLAYGSYLHGFVAMKSLPSMTCASMVANLTDLAIRDYAICQQFEPLDIGPLIQKAEGKIAKIRRSLAGGSKNISSEVDLERLTARVHSLSSGHVHAFLFQTLIHCWAKTEEELQEKIGRIQAGIHSLSGARSYYHSLPTSSLKAHLGCSPGLIHTEGNFHLFAEDRTISHLLPLAENESLSDDYNESLFNGVNGSVVGINTFSQKGKTGSPQHCVVVAKTGGGKSLMMHQMLSETQMYYGYIVIIESGLSYGNYVKTFSGNHKTFNIEPHGSETLNYLSTRGRPLDAQHIGTVIDILTLMVGDIGLPESVVTGLIRRAIMQFYVAWAEQWREKQASDLCDISHRECYARMSEDDQPCHSDMSDWLKDFAATVTEYSDDYRKLALALEGWRRDIGRYSLFDGKNTIDVTGRIIHLELGGLNDAPEKLKAIAVYIITNMIRAHITHGLERSVKKIVLFEELGSFCALPKASVVLREFYERMRRYSCFVCSVLQQLSNLDQEISNSIIGNSRQAILLLQDNRDEVRFLQEAYGLSDSAAESLLNFKEPSREEGAAFLHLKAGNGRWIATTGYNICCPEMFYCGNTSGGVHEEQKAHLDASTDFIDAICIGAQKMDSDSQSKH